MTQQKFLKNEGWNKLSFAEQLANIGSEVIRAIKWKSKGNSEYKNLAFYRSLDLIDSTVSDKKNINRLKEILRLRELLVDYFFGINVYRSTAEFFQKYFYSFNYFANLHK